jgi:hypothetical protein
MIEVAKQMSKLFIDTSASIYPYDSDIVITMMVASFTGAYSMLDIDERTRVMIVLLHIIQDIGGEKFEDGPDFLDFITEKMSEKKREE